MNREYVSLYVEKEKAEEYKKLQGNIPDDDIMQKYIEHTKRDIKIDLDSLDDELLQYRANMSKWQKEMKGCYNEVSEKGYVLWEEFDGGRINFEQKMKSFLASAVPVKNLLSDMERSIQNINTWNIEKMLELIQKISIMSSKEKDMLELLLNNNK